MPNSSNFSKTIALMVGVLAMAFLISFIVFAWTEPSQPPPLVNVPTPINVGAIDQTKTGGLGVKFLSVSSADNDKIRLSGTQADPHTIWLGDSKGLRFWDDTNGELMRITNTGNVGIGTTNPAQKLDVAGNMNLNNNQAMNFRVENVSSLPPAGNKGRLVFLTTDNKLYFDDGTAFRTILDPAGITSATMEDVLSASPGSMTGYCSGDSFFWTWNEWGKIGTTETDIDSVQVTVSGDEYVVAVASAMFSHGGGTLSVKTVTLKLYRETTLLDSKSQALSNPRNVAIGHLSLDAIEKPPAGTYTYKLRGIATLAPSFLYRYSFNVYKVGKID